MPLDYGLRWHSKTMKIPPAVIAPIQALHPARTCRLPNGLKVRYVSKEDVKFLWHEIREDQVQLQHGITIGPGGVVLDVGGYAGLQEPSAAVPLRV